MKIIDLRSDTIVTTHQPRQLWLRQRLAMIWEDPQSTVYKIGGQV